MTIKLLYECKLTVKFSLNEGKKCVLLYHTYARPRTRAYAQGTVAAACCMLQIVQ